MPGMQTAAAIVRPSPTVAGRVRPPGDKSISHRYALLAALAEGSSTIAGFSPGADCASTLACLDALGVRIRHTGPGRLAIDGRGPDALVAPHAVLDAGNSGTTIRLLSGVVAGRPFTTVLDGDASLARRPMRRIIEPLTRMGAAISARDGRPPLTIHGTALRAITHAPEVPSAQVKSAVLLAGLQADGTTTVIEPSTTRDHTERALRAFGVEVQQRGPEISLRGGQSVLARDLTVPGDISSAAFWVALVAASPGSAVEIEGVGLNSTRTRVLEVVRRAGAIVRVHVETDAAGEPVGRIHVEPGSPRGFAIDPEEVPAVIDEIPALAALAARLPPGERMRVEGAGELRVKESDRIACLAAGLRAFGVEVEEYPDGFETTAGPLHSAHVDACGDHRLAMAFAVVACGAADGPSTIAGAASVDVSYPGFFEVLGRLASHGDPR